MVSFQSSKQTPIEPDRPAQSPSFELRSEEVQDIISSVPAWLVRWGITLLFLLLLVLLSLSWLIHYPDVVRASFRLTSVNAPKLVVARTEGKIVKLLAQDNSLVEQEDVLAYLESTASHVQVLALRNRLDSVSRLIGAHKTERLADLSQLAFDQLGELQPAFQTYQLTYLELLAFLSDGFYLAKKGILQQEYADLLQLEKNLREQLQIYRQDYQIAIQEFGVQQQLARDKVIAPLELKREESKLLSRKMPFKQAETAIFANRAAQHAKRKELLELNKQIGEQQSRFLQTLHTLRSGVEAWQQKYLLTAPVGGRVHFVSFLEENQTLPVGQEVFYVAPESTRHYGELRIAQYNLGKVQPGQRVVIKFAGYPFEEFGAVKGRVAFISQIPGRDSTFLAKVDIPDGLRTTYNKPITYRLGMQATAEIITQDRRLLQRVFHQFRKIQNEQ